MNAKLFEVRDHGTFIPAIGISMDPSESLPGSAEHYLLRRAGYGSCRCILLARADGHGSANYDPYEWPNRTMRGAHLYIEQRWDELKSGDVVDARVGLGEATQPVASERFA